MSDSDKNEEAKRSTFRRPHQSDNSGNVADWKVADATKIQSAIASAGAKHGALRFGYSRDGGAYAIGVYAGIEYFTDYVRPSENIDDYLDRLTEAFNDYDPNADQAMQSQAKKGRK